MGLRREREEEMEHLLNKGALWAVTYGDLMSYLMIFFLILFTFAVSGEARFAEGVAGMQTRFGGSEGESLARQRRRERELTVADDLKSRLHSRGLQKFAAVEVSEHRIQVTMREPVLFASGRAELKDSARPMLREFAASVRELPNRIVVEGHTDSVPVASGPYPSNWELSLSRAAGVIRYLVETEGIDPARVSGAGYAEFKPVAANESASGRALNRRIELSLLRRER